MQRRHWVEISDEAWCPQGIRRLATDYCRLVAELSHAFEVVTPLFAQALQSAKASRVLDLGSGAGGPWQRLEPRLRHYGFPVSVFLSDHNPHIPAFERAARRSGQTIQFHSAPVDAAH